MFRAVLTSALDGIIMTDNEGRIIEFNPAAEKLFGWSHDEILGREMMQTLLPLELRAAHRRQCAQSQGKRVETRALRADSTEFPAEFSVSRVFEDPPIFPWFVRDIRAPREVGRHRVTPGAANRRA